MDLRHLTIRTLVIAALFVPAAAWSSPPAAKPATNRQLGRQMRKLFRNRAVRKELRNVYTASLRSQGGLMRTRLKVAGGLVVSTGLHMLFGSLVSSGTGIGAALAPPTLLVNTKLTMWTGRQWSKHRATKRAARKAALKHALDKGYVTRDALGKRTLSALAEGL